MRRKLGELRVVPRMEIATRDQEDFIAPRGVCEFANIRAEFLGTGNVKLATGQHEINLYIHFPKNEITRWHSTVPFYGSRCS